MAASSSKSSKTATKLVIALLALWSIVSLIVIVVWATSPDLKGSTQCRSELRDAQVKLEGVRVVANKDRVALEEKVEEEREKQGQLMAQILVLKEQLNATNTSLEKSQQENTILNMNISVLQENIVLLQQIEVNLTARISQQEDHIEILQENMTQAFFQTDACFSMRDAAKSQAAAARSEVTACEASKQYLQKQLQKCKAVTPEVPQQTQQVQDVPSSDSEKSSASPLTGFPALSLLVCGALRLIT